ncbi:MAG TPA: peptidylprolyl isomerase [Gemmatimonadaceae bacterium]|nr:peptidylprolyl isomerase [Gemmatimonadaceae bacterium]
MRTQFLATSLLALSASLSAQQPVAAAPTKPVPLEGIVAVVGDQLITRFDLQEAYLAKIQRGEVPPPKTREDTLTIERDALNDMVEEELLIQKAKDLKVEVTDADITPAVDNQVKNVRAGFTNETEFRNALAKAGMGTPEEYRRYLMDQLRRRYTHEKVLRKLQQDGKIIPVNVTDAEVAAEFEKEKPFLGPKPAAVTFKQIVIMPQASAAAKEAARVKAESLLVQIRAGGDFDRIAKRESMDLASKETGGDLGWIRRGRMVADFDVWLFGGPFRAPLQPGQVSPVFETPYGFHIVRVDRVQTGEVKARQILIVPKIDSSDIARTAKLADSVAALLKSGVPFDTLAKKYHDYAGNEETGILDPYPRDSLPVQYQKAFLLHKPNDIVTFQIPGPAQRPDVPKFVVAQLLTVTEGGERTLDEVKAAVRADLALRGGVRRYVDTLRKQTYVAIRLDEADADDAKRP